jgi:hypothetical protein
MERNPIVRAVGRENHFTDVPLIEEEIGKQTRLCLYTAGFVKVRTGIASSRNMLRFRGKERIHKWSLNSFQLRIYSSVIPTFVPLSLSLSL